MKPILTITAVAFALTAPAWAQTVMDADGDGNVTLEEAQAVMPEMTEDSFASMDSDADGVLSTAEVAAATEAGLLPS